MVLREETADESLRSHSRSSGTHTALPSTYQVLPGADTAVSCPAAQPQLTGKQAPRIVEALLHPPRDTSRGLWFLGVHLHRDYFGGCWALEQVTAKEEQACESRRPRTRFGPESLLEE